jgi:hypothetical protein
MSKKTISDEGSRNSVTLEKSEFLILHKAIFERFGKDNSLSYQELFSSENKPRTKFYPTGSSDEKVKITLAQHMGQDLWVKSAMEADHWPVLNGKKLYEYLGKAEAGDSISVNRQYLKIYCLYIGCKDLEAFRTKYVQKRTEYLAYHYSTKKKEVLVFDCSMGKRTDNVKRFDSTIKGYWLRDPERTCVGEGHLMEDGLFFALTDGFHGYFYMVIHTPAKAITLNNAFLTGRILTSSSGGNPIHSEVLLVKKDHSWRDDEILFVRRYMRLRRATHHTERQEANGDLSGLLIRELKPSDFKIQTGCYRAWFYNRRGNLLQQKFVITREYESYLQQKSAFSDEIITTECRLSLNDQPSKRVLVSLFRPKITNAIGYTILQNLRPGADFLVGAHINVGDENHPPSHHAVVVRYEPDESYFQPEVFRPGSEEFTRLVTSHPVFPRMKEALDALEKTNKMP